MMQRFSWQPGNQIALFNAAYKVVAVDDNHQFTLEDQNGLHHIKSLDYLLEQYSQRNLKAASSQIDRKAPERRVTFQPAFTDQSEKAKKRAYESYLYVSRLRDNGVPKSPDSPLWIATVQEVTEELGRIKPPHFTTILRWYKRSFLLDDNPRAFTPNFSARGGPGKARFHEEVIRLMDRTIDELYLSSDRLPCTQAHADLKRVIADRNSYLPETKKLRVPSYTSFSRHIRRRSAYEIYASRHGRQAAEKKFRQTTIAEGVNQILQRVEIDHTPLDLFVIDSATGLPLGRPRLTVAIDKASRAILGFDIGFTGNSAQATLNCLKHAILPKTYMKERYPEVQGEYPMYGCPSYVVVDNGNEFHSASLKAALFDLGISIFYCPADEPHWKGTVERFFRTISQDLLGSLPGASLGHFYLRVGDKHPKDLAVIDLAHLQKLIHIWIVDIYHQKPHKGIRCSPLKAWQERRGFVDIQLPHDPEELNMVCSDIAERSIFHYGIELFGIRGFNNEQLQEIRNHLEHTKAVKVRVRWNGEKMERCWVEDPRTKEWFEVLNRDPQTRDLSQIQVSLLGKMQRQAENCGEAIGVAEARKRLRDLARQLLQSKRMRDRRRALSILGLSEGDSSASVLHTDQTAKTKPAHPNLERPAPRQKGSPNKMDAPPPPHVRSVPAPIFKVFKVNR
jgi:putative transposase